MGGGLGCPHGAEAQFIDKALCMSTMYDSSGLHLLFTHALSASPASHREVNYKEKVDHSMPVVMGSLWLQSASQGSQLQERTHTGMLQKPTVTGGCQSVQLASKQNKAAYK